MLNWKDPQYLRHGNPRQRRAYAVVQALDIAHVLHAFDPVVAGTIPLGIDLPTSDIDIICEVAPEGRVAFSQLLRSRYGQLPGFRVRQCSVSGHEVVVSCFHYEEMAVELFGQALPTTQQHAYRHLVVEHAVLQAGGEAWRTAVRHLKQQGLKTEPAFAALLQLPGDPYAALLTLEGLSAAELAARVAACPLPNVP